MLKYLVFLLALLVAVHSSPTEDFTAAIQKLKSQRQLKGIQVQMTKNSQVLYNLNLGEKNEAGESIDNNTMFRIASVSKSFSSVAIMQLVEQGKLSLNQSLTSIFGYKIENPFFPGVDITVEMILTHQSSILECDPYYSDFLDATYKAKTGREVPNIKQILLKGGKYYNDCVYSKVYKPGSHHQYVNINFGIAGTIVELISQKRFDLYQRENILKPLSEGLSEIATFNPVNIKNINNLGVIYIGKSQKWTPNYDYYPDGKITEANLTDYKVGENGVIFGPQGSLRASASHLTQYAMMLANGGKTKQGKAILSAQSVNQILKPRYQFHGLKGGAIKDDHQYGFGIFTTTYRRNDRIFSHEVVKGHTGAAYNLISAQYFWGNFTLTYIINGALNGYKSGTSTIYLYERQAIHTAAEAFANSYQLPKRETNIMTE